MPEIKIFQLVRVHNTFILFPKNHLIRGRYLGIEEDPRDNMTFIIKIVRDRKKSRLTRNVVQEVYPIAVHLRRIQVKYCSSALFNYGVNRKRNATVNESKIKRRCTGRVQKALDITPALEYRRISDN